MNIQKKVASVLLIILLILAGVIFTVVYNQTSQLLHAQSEHEMTLLTESAKQQANSVFQSLIVGTKGSVETGDMDLFSDLLADLVTVHNITELGMSGPDGVINYSSSQSVIGSQLDKEVYSQAQNNLNGNIGILEKDNQLILSRAQVFVEKCIECHDNAKVGDLGGVLYQHYDLTELNTVGIKVEQTLAAGLSSATKSMLLTAVVGGALGIIIIYYVLGTLVRRPLLLVGGMFDQMAAGKFDGRLNLKRNDEIGNIADILDNFADLMEQDLLATLQKLANGDISYEINPRSEDDSIRLALKKVGDDLNDMVTQIKNGATQIVAGAAAVSAGSQSLSEGATDSASSVEEISASMNELSTQTKVNADTTQQANILVTQVRDAADQGNNQMQQMVTAMTDINASSLSISKIIKVIDEIAFQTNLLALNAAVEAARAGQHGKGFAVVAEEVRNLAARSAKAAQETAAMIESSVSQAEQGVVVANNTASAFGSIVVEIQKVNDLIAEISAANAEQANGISQINDGVARIDDVIQQNTANAEQGAASAEELSSQATQLEAVLRRFTLRPSSQPSYQPAPARIAPLPSQPQTPSSGWGGGQSTDAVQIALDDSEFGKF